MSKILEIVLTGGPGGGKTTSVGPIKRHFDAKGIPTFVVQEISSAMIIGGVSSRSVGQYDYQVMQMQLQLYWRKLFLEMAEKKMKQEGAEFALVVYDRWAMDGKAFCDDLEPWNKMLGTLNLNEEELLAIPDLVIHMVTAADGAEEAYTLNNNAARTESKDDAIKRDKLLKDIYGILESWVCVDNTHGIDNKVQEVINCIENKIEVERTMALDERNNEDMYEGTVLGNLRDFLNIDPENIDYFNNFQGGVWALTGDHVLHIKSTGDFEGPFEKYELTARPHEGWDDYRIDMAEITCRNIGNYAFSNDFIPTKALDIHCERIWGDAFLNCNELDNIDMHTKTIDAYAFTNCERLMEVAISDCKLIKSDAFFNCPELTTVYFRGTDIDIQDNAFNNCEHLSIIAFEVDPGDKINPHMAPPDTEIAILNSDGTLKRSFTLGDIEPTHVKEEQVGR